MNEEGTIVTMEDAPSPTTTYTQENGAPLPPEDGQPQPQPNPIMQLLPFFLIIVVMYLFLFRGPKKKQQQHQKMVASLRKNDRVRTIGGIFGTVLEVRDDEVVLKIDETNNVKIRVLPSAIATVMGGDKAD